MTGMNGCIGIMMALRHREQTGKGQVIDCALFESVFRILDEIAPRYSFDGFIREPEGTGTLNACPHGHFPCKDDKFIAIACTTDKMFERLTAAMQRPDLLEKFGVQSTRLANREIVLSEVEKWTLSFSRDNLIEICTKSDVPAGAINSISDIFNDPHFEERQVMKNFQVPKLGKITVPNVIPGLSDSPGAVEFLGPDLGQDNYEIYKQELGLSEEDLNELKNIGVI
jgi:crotonobetainyl-CoA:carnitine CoA-transferase CaiB-like acyl-CoA transferase